MQKKLLSGAEIVIETLKGLGVSRVFGYPGASILNIYDAMYRLGGIRHIRTSHEQGAAHAADGFARASGEVGVCFATSGPGATNLVTGIATAYMDSSPLLCITCNVKSSLIAHDAFQEADITGITAPITKNNYLVSDISELEETIIEAYSVAKSGRCGPVLVDITQDVTAAKYCFSEVKIKEEKNEAEKLSEDVFSLVSGSERPVILAGGGVVASGTREEVIKLSERLGAPICASLMGLSAGFGEVKAFLGMAGVHGSGNARRALNRADLIIALGTRLSDRLTDGFRAKAEILHIDTDRAELGKNLSATTVCGDLASILPELLSSLPKGKRELWFSPAEEEKTHRILTANAVVVAVPAGAVVATDVGLHQMAVARGYRFTRNRSFITSGGFGTMGFGLPAAIGASLALGREAVFNISGDGSFRMNLQELSTVRQYNVPVITVVIDNGRLGMVTDWQDKLYDRRRAESELDGGDDFAKIAEGFGIPAYAPKTPKELAKLLSELYRKRESAVVICKVR